MTVLSKKQIKKLYKQDGSRFQKFLIKELEDENPLLTNLNDMDKKRLFKKKFKVKDSCYLMTKMYYINKLLENDNHYIIDSSAYNRILNS